MKVKCETGKVRYGTDMKAERALASTLLTNWSGQPRRKEQRVYRCGVCGGWHLTSQPQKMPWSMERKGQK